MGENFLLDEVAFEQFRQYCRARGFELSYYSPEIFGSRKEIAGYPFDGPKVVRLRKRLFGFSGVPYDVAHWQRESWRESFSRLKAEFLEKVQKEASPH